LRHRIITAALALAVLSTGQALADDSVPPVIGHFVVGGAVQAPAVDGAPADATANDDGSLWTDVRNLFSGATVSIGAAPRGDEQALTADPADPGYNAHANINIAGFSVGGRFARWGETAFSETERQSFGVGASYSVNAWTVGIDWSRGDYDEGFLDLDTGDSSDVIAFTSSYALRPNVKINGLLEYSEDQPAQDHAAPGAFTVGIGTLINF
jgi:predicted porin